MAMRLFSLERPENSPPPSSPDRMAFKVFSSLLDQHIYLVEDDDDKDALRTSGIKEAVYTHDEILQLKDMSKESLKIVAAAKDMLFGSIESVER